MTCHHGCFFSWTAVVPPGPGCVPLLSWSPNSNQFRSAAAPCGLGAEGSAGGLLNVVMDSFQRCAVHRVQAEANTGENRMTRKRDFIDESLTAPSSGSGLPLPLDRLAIQRYYVVVVIITK
jgi:hypothetical protein